jgi:hypothetical protein
MPCIMQYAICRGFWLGRSWSPPKVDAIRELCIMRLCNTRTSTVQHNPDSDIQSHLQTTRESQSIPSSARCRTYRLVLFSRGSSIALYSSRATTFASSPWTGTTTSRTCRRLCRARVLLHHADDIVCSVRGYNTAVAACILSLHMFVSLRDGPRRNKSQCCAQVVLGGPVMAWGSRRRALALSVFQAGVSLLWPDLLADKGLFFGLASGIPHVLFL